MSALLVELNRLPRVRAYRRNAGRLPNGSGGMVKVGVTGQSDIWLLAWPGIHVEIECKIGDAKLTAPQERWREIVTGELGALHVHARARPDVTAHEAAAFWCGYIDEAIRERRRALAGSDIPPPK